MLELARISDRDAVGIIAKQAHSLHVCWRPDNYNMPDEIFPEDRFAEGITSREIFVVRKCDLILGIHVRTYNWPGVVERK